VEFNNLKAALFVVIAMSMITTNDAIIKHITEVFNVGQIMFLRGALICVIFACVMRLRGQPVFQRRSLHRWNLLRALFELCATLFFLTGLSLLPIAVGSTLGLLVADLSGAACCCCAHGNSRSRPLVDYCGRFWCCVY